MLIYDPMPGGSGFLQQLREHWHTVCLRAQEIMETCDCDEACYGCLLTFWNQRHHAILSRTTAIEVLRANEGEMQFGTAIPPYFAEPQDKEVEEESDPEELFVQILKNRRFPGAGKQHQVALEDGTTTFADFAYQEEKVLIYIDGTSEQLHGDPERRRADHLTRVKLRSKGYQVVESTAEALHDQTALNRMLNEIAVYLGREDLLSDR